MCHELHQHLSVCFAPPNRQTSRRAGRNRLAFLSVLYRSRVHEDCHELCDHLQRQRSIYARVFHLHGIGQDGRKQPQSIPQHPCEQSIFEKQSRQWHKLQNRQTHWHVPKWVYCIVLRVFETLQLNQTHRRLLHRRCQYQVRQHEHQVVQWLHEKKPLNLHKRLAPIKPQAMHHGAQACHELVG